MFPYYMKIEKNKIRKRILNIREMIREKVVFVSFVRC